MGLTPVQANALAFISLCIAENGVAPSYAEIGTALGLASKSGVARLMGSLEERGAIRRLRKHARAIEVIGHRVDILPRLPSLSTAALLAIRDRINVILNGRVS